MSGLDARDHTSTGGPPWAKRLPWIILAASAALIVVVALLPRPEPAPYNPDNSGEAVAQCEDLVLDHLKAPSTAEFGQTQAERSDGTWIVTGHVDAENSFGAMLRSDFQCSVRVSDGGVIERRLDFIE